MTWSTFVGSASSAINTKSSSATSQRARTMSVGVAVRLNTLFTSVGLRPATSVSMARKFCSVLSNTSAELEAPTRATILFRASPTSHPGKTTRGSVNSSTARTRRRAVQWGPAAVRNQRPLKLVNGLTSLQHLALGGLQQARGVMP